MEGRDPRARYAKDLCRTRDWKARTHYGPQKPLQVRSNGNARQPKPSDVRLTYADAVELVEFILTEQSHVQPERRPSLARSYVLARLSPKAAARAQDLGL